MIFNKPNDPGEAPARTLRRRNRPDFALLLLRFIFLGFVMGFFNASLPLPNLPPTWALLGEPLVQGRIAVFFLTLILVFSLRKAREWERAVVLRLGKFHKVKGPGLFFLLPLLDQVFRIIDIRIRVTDFYVQETLTGDSVTLRADAFCFWLVWDPQKAALEVEDYEAAVTLASMAALRNAISKNDLTTFLARGDLIEKQIQEEVDKQTTEWGITVQFIQLTDIQIPPELQDSLSRVAQAEREKQARILLAEAEIEIAGKLEEAISIYSKNESAMKLKILSILNEGLKAGNSMMLVPNSVADELKNNDVFGLAALNELKKNKNEEDKSKSS